MAGELKRSIDDATVSHDQHVIDFTKPESEKFVTVFARCSICRRSAEILKELPVCKICLVVSAFRRCTVITPPDYKKDQSREECLICLKNFVGFPEAQCGSCVAVFHDECASSWIKESSEKGCPMCRSAWYGSPLKVAVL